MKRKFSIGTLAILAAGILLGRAEPTVGAAQDNMILTVTNYEAGISYREVQSHAPIGWINNPCSYADNFAPTIDWNDGTGEHKPDTNAETKLFYTKVPVIQNGVYLFWDDTHVGQASGAQTVITKLTVHCLGDPPGDQVYVTRNEVNVFARIPVNEAKFTKDGKAIDSVKGHDTVDLTVTLNAPAPASGTWVKLEAEPAGLLNSLPPYFHIPARQTQATISAMELHRPTVNATLVVSASTIGRPQKTQQLTVLP
ncbi:MAG TPA: hypothetical protein VGD60_17345 [Candidatus Acidoferrales bacterium]